MAKPISVKNTMGRKGLACVAVLSLLLSACVLVESETNLPTDDIQMEMEADHLADIPIAEPLAPFPNPASLERSDVYAPANITPPQTRAPGDEEIRILQERLRASGFDPGSPDGIFGPKTRKAWLKLVSGCAMLPDLLEITHVLHNTPNASLRKIISDRFSHQAEVRLLQVRLKDAGFDPGYIDGIFGPKTNSALLRLHSGCALVTMFSTSGSGELVFAEERDLAEDRAGVVGH